MAGTDGPLPSEHSWRPAVRLLVCGLLLACSSATVGIAAPATPAPTLRQTAVARAVSGRVLVRAPRTSGFTTLAGSAVIPMGYTVDTTAGRARLTTALPAGRGTQTADFYGGRFALSQARSGLTTLRLNESLSCARPPAAPGTAKLTRRLWGSGRGSFRTVGRYSAATVQGTVWLTKDTCSTTTTVVARGRVGVDDFRRQRHVTVTAPHSYVAPARR